MCKQWNTIRFGYFNIFMCGFCMRCPRYFIYKLVKKGHDIVKQWLTNVKAIEHCINSRKSTNRGFKYLQYIEPVLELCKIKKYHKQDYLGVFILLHTSLKWFNFLNFKFLLLSVEQVIRKVATNKSQFSEPDRYTSLLNLDVFHTLDTLSEVKKMSKYWKLKELITMASFKLKIILWEKLRNQEKYGKTKLLRFLFFCKFSVIILSLQDRLNTTLVFISFEFLLILAAFLRSQVLTRFASHVVTPI